jgi:hypothetical protein
MKYIKRFNEQEKSIEDWCDELFILEYEIENGLLNVNNAVSLYGKGLEKIPIQFGKVGGDFNCSSNKLSSLEGCPNIIGNSFYCRDNFLVSLKDGPKEIAHSYSCSDNILKTLENLPIKLKGGFGCENNKLTSLIGGPIEVGRYYICTRNKLKTLEGAPEKVGGNFLCDYNPIYEIFKLFRTYERYQASLDYKYLRGANIVRGRFAKACEDADIKMPDSIPGYKYIDL